MSEFFPTPPSEFRFDSELRCYLTRFMTEHKLTYRKIAIAIGWSVTEVSEYRNDRRRLTNEKAQELSGYLGLFGENIAPNQLVAMQKIGVYVDLVDSSNNLLAVLGRVKNK